MNGLLIRFATGVAEMQAVSRYFQVLRSVFALMAILLIAGCNSPTNSFLLNGIGAELPARDIVNATRLQIKYFNYLCRQAGLPVDPVNETTYCRLPPSDVASWTLVVSQGMNDIDRRCDAYLQWLDNKKRSKGPLLSQIGTTKTTVQEIIEVTVPNAANAVKAISVVGMAFQLLSDTIENYHSRLLLEINSSTVNSIVLQGRYDFRKHLRDEGITFRSKPEAEHALRSYLRLCLPFAIEAKINNFSTLGASGERPGEGNTLGDLPVVGAAVPQPSAPIEADTKVFKPDRPKIDETPVRERIDAAIQKALCTKADGEKGDKTTEAIRIYQYVERQEETGSLSENQENDIINKLNDCDPKLANYLERTEFSNDHKNVDALKQLREDLQKLAAASSADVTISDTDSLDDLRPKIETIKKKIGGDVLQSGQRAYLNTQYTPDLQLRLINLD